MLKQNFFEVLDRNVLMVNLDFQLFLILIATLLAPVINKVVDGLILRDCIKKMIIGHRGQKIKEFGQMARKELEQALNKKVFLELDVEVDN